VCVTIRTEVRRNNCFYPRMDSIDRAYYLRRSQQELEAARNATCREARGRHEELAAAYDLRGRQDSRPTGEEIQVPPAMATTLSDSAVAELELRVR